jgi:hypothetical protein
MSAKFDEFVRVVVINISYWQLSNTYIVKINEDVIWDLLRKFMPNYEEKINGWKLMEAI